MNHDKILCIQKYIYNLYDALSYIKRTELQEVSSYYKGKHFILYTGEIKVINSICYDSEEKDIVVTFNVFHSDGTYFYYDVSLLGDVNLDEFE